MRVLRLHLSLVMTTLILSSCTITFPQFESMFDRNNNALAGRERLPNEWLVQTNSVGVVMLPYTKSGLTVFANAETGDAVSFDGWMIRSIVGFSHESPITLYRADGKLIVSRGEATDSVTCDEYERFTTTSFDGVTWQQECDRGKLVNKIEVNDQGEIVLITQYAGFGEFIELERY